MNKLLSIIFVLILFMQNAPVRAQDVQQEAASLKLQAQEYYDTNQYDSAIVKWKQSASHYFKLKNYNDYIDCNNEIGHTLTVLGQFEASNTTLTINLEEGKKYLSDTSKQVSRTYYYLGSNQGFNGMYEESLLNLTKALEIAQKLGEKHRYEVAIVLNGLGRVAFLSSNYKLALKHFNASLKLFILEESDPTNYVSCYVNIGNIYLIKGQYELAVEHYEKANRLIPEKAESLDKAGIYNNLGYSFFEIGELDAALTYYQKSLSMRIKLLGEHHSAVATSLANIGNVYYKFNNVEQALIHYGNALEIRREQLNENHPDIGRNLMNMGLMYHLLKEHIKADDYLNEAVDILSKGVGSEHQYVGEAWLNLATNYRSQENWTMARLSLSNSVQIFNITQSTNDLISAHLQLAQMPDSSLFIGVKHCEQALKLLFPDQATSNYEQLGKTVSASNFNVLLRIFEELAAIHESIYELNSNQENLRTALKLREVSVNVIDRMRFNYRSDISKLYNDEGHNETYAIGLNNAKMLYAINQKLYYKTQAYWFLEKAKSRILHTSLIESKAKKIGGIDPLILKKLQKYKEDLTYLERELQIATAQNQQGLEDKLFKLKREYSNLRDSIRLTYPRYHLLTQYSKIPDVGEVQRNLPQATAILDYFIGESDITIVVITREKFELISRPKHLSLDSIIKSTYSAINKRNKANFLLNSKHLYSALIEPIMDHLVGIEILKIIPHRDLWYLPFECLITNDPKNNQLENASYLLSKFVISYHYSSSIMLENKSLNIKSNPGLMAFAPVFNRTDYQQHTQTLNTERYAGFRSQDYGHDRLEPLPESKNEVVSIQKLFSQNGMETSVFLHGESTEDQFKKNSSQYGYLHLATHSFVNEELPNYSGIFFSKPDSTAVSIEDGILFSGELYNLDLNSELVVLSSCESGVGKLTKGEGLLSMSRGFYHSGAKQIVYSLWKVYDRSTSNLMVRFYDHILKGKSPVLALHQAKLEMLEKKATSFPKNWSGFVLLGD